MSVKLPTVTASKCAVTPKDRIRAAAEQASIWRQMERYAMVSNHHGHHLIITSMLELNKSAVCTW